jgi:ATP-dependent DNA helicase RecG
MENILDADLITLGVSAKRAEVLKNELNVLTARDLLYYLPFRYSPVFYSIKDLKNYNAFNADELPVVQLKGKIHSLEDLGNRITGIFQDATGTIALVWFNYRYQMHFYPNQNYFLCGEVSIFNGNLQISNPVIRTINQHFTEKRINPKQQSIYHSTSKLTKQFDNKNFQYNFAKFIEEISYKILPCISETLPDYIIENQQLLSLRKTLGNVHFPQSSELLQSALYRIKFEELFYIQLNILKQKFNRKDKKNGFIFDNQDDILKTFYQDFLPFTLTKAQIRVIKEIRKDLHRGEQMNRLLQGDVGSGKTIVALITALMAIDNGYQACIMAPTEILARQHFNSIEKLTQSLGINVKLLVGATRKKEREQIHNSLIDGSLHIIIGTHALIEDKVQFQNLGLAVIDEQHRFGVAQRAKLYAKNIQPPHILAMSATPIPRTLAMTFYGDLDVSVIDELPPGRKPIKTFLYFDNKRADLNRFIYNEVEQGRQIYVVFPLIEESEKMDLKNLEDGYLLMKETFPQIPVAMLHGKMLPAEKEQIMTKFKSGDTKILLSTTVIEVGVDVPNASVMVIEDAQRFGLSQLHQLRGRVGRGAEQSYCILMSAFKIAGKTRERLQVLVDTNDGFVIAQKDLLFRGPGMLEGTMQSGQPFDLKVADLQKDEELIAKIRDIVNEMLDEDSTLSLPKNEIPAYRLSILNNNAFDWLTIS